MERMDRMERMERMERANRMDRSERNERGERNERNGCGCGCNNSRDDCASLLDRIRKIDFSLVETILFLDVYPCSTEALEYYHKLRKMREELVAKYQATCGPLTAYGNDSECEWNWIKSPWPWELEANR